MVASSSEDKHDKYVGLQLVPLTWLLKGHHHHHRHHLFLNREGRWGTTDDFTTSFIHSSLFSIALWELANSVYSLMLSSNLFLCLPCLLPPITVPCKMVLARPDEREACPYHCSLRLFTLVRRSSCGLIACWILARTFSLVTWSLYEMCSILWQHVLSVACILLWSSAVRFMIGKRTGRWM